MRNRPPSTIVCLAQVPHTFYRFAYFDTNILSEIAKRIDIWQRLIDFLADEDLTLAISSQVAELASANRLHERLGQLLIHVPSAIIKSWNVVLAEEVASHPNERFQSLLGYPLNAMLIEDGGPDKLVAFCPHQNSSTPARCSAKVQSRC
jgi:hypothetical protein